MMMKVEMIKNESLFKKTVMQVSGMNVTVSDASTARSFNPKFRATFKMEGADHPGIVYSITNFLREHSVWIEDLHTELRPAPFGGAVLFYMSGKVRMERGMYQYRCYHASHDEDCMHTTVDGSDQTAFGLPHFPQDDKVTSEGFKYKVRLLSSLIELHV